MAIGKITYDNKEAIQNDTSVPEKNKVTDANMNEIKQVINDNANELITTQNNIEDLQEGQGTADVDIANLKNRVSILETDNSKNKSDISELQLDNETNKENISTLQEQFSNFENYDDTEIKQDIEEIKQEQIQQNTNIEQLKQENEQLKNALINIQTEQLKSLHIADASTIPAQLEVLGNQEQEIREGYNLINASSIGAGNIGGVNYSVENDIITLNGNYNETYPVSIKNLINNVPKINSNFKFQIYPISGSCEYSNIGVRFNNTDGVQINYIQLGVNSNNYITKSMDLTGLDTVDIFIASRNDATFNNYKFKLMFIEGTEEKQYEQYGASPSPNYPSPVVCLGSNKNILDLKAQTQNGITVTKNADDTLNMTGTATASGILSLLNENIVLKANKSYTFSVKKVSGQDISNSIWFWNVTDLNSEITLTLTNNVKAFTPTKDTTLSALNMSVNQGDVFDITLALKVEKGTQTSYSPNNQGSTGIKISNVDKTKEISKILYIQQEMLEGDYFVKEADGWKEVHYHPKLIFTGDENWRKSSNTSVDRFTFNTTEYPAFVEGFSNYFIITKGITLNKGTLIFNDGKQIIINFSDYGTTTLEQFKAWLQEKYNSGNPVYVYYKTTTPTKLPCAEEQIAVLEELNNLELFKGTNNIITTEDIALLKLNYIADTKIYVDNKYN